MGEQEFRQPQFSQDSAWLPTWLQAHFLERGMQPGNSNSTSRIECKALEGLLESIRNGEEAACCSALGQQICSLIFSGDDCTASDRSQSIENLQELAFYLSLSSDNDVELSATKAIVGPLQEKHHCNVTLDKPEFVSGINQSLCSQRETGNRKDATEDLMRVNVFPGKKIPTQDECTPCTELYVPENIQQGDNTKSTICAVDCSATFFATKSEVLDSKTILCSACDTSNTETFVPQQIVMGSDQKTLQQQSGKQELLDKREGQLRNKTSDIDAAIGLTVAAAEAVVISDLLETCRLSESIGSSEILEAAIKLKQAREMCGLDKFSDFSSGPMDEVDDSCLDDLDDNYMEDAFADVGLFVMESRTPPFGLCSADVFESEDSKRITGKKKCSILPARDKLGHPSEEMGFTLSKLEVKVAGSDDEKDDGVHVSIAMASFSDSGDRGLHNRVVNTKGQQSDSMGKAQIILKHAVGSTVNHDVNTKPSESGLFVTCITRSSENSLDKDMNARQLEQSPPFIAYEKSDKDTSFETDFPSIENLAHCSHESANETIEIVSATPHCDNDAVYKGMNSESEKETANSVQSNVISSPSWLHLPGNKVEEILRPDISESCDSVECQNQIQTGNHHSKGSENADYMQDTIIPLSECLRPFASRWFGGWTGLDKQMETNKKSEVTIRIQKRYVEEISHFTESLDRDEGSAAPVQSFFTRVLKLPLNNIHPISKVHIEDLSTNNEVSYSLTQNSARCLSSPVYDPLCSMVPCSIPQEDDLHTKRNNVDICEGDQNCSGKLCIKSSVQLHEGLKPMPEEIMVELSKPSELNPFKDSGQAISRFNCESQFCAKRKRVDSLKHYSTLPGVLQCESIEVPCQTKETGFLGGSSNDNFSMESSKLVSPGADIVTHINDKKFVNMKTGAPRELDIQDSGQKLTRVCLSAGAGIGIPSNSNREVAHKLPDVLLELAPTSLTRDVGYHNGSTDKGTPGRNLSMFQDHRKDVVAVNSIATGNRSEHKDFDCTQNDVGNLGMELDVSLDVEESSPLLLHRRKRRFKAARIIESGSKDNKWDKGASTCPNQSTAPGSDNVKCFELARKVFGCTDLCQQESHEQLSSKVQDIKNKKRVHFSEKNKIIEHQAGIDNCQQDHYQNLCTWSSEKHKVYSDVSGFRNLFEASLKMQSVEVGKKIGKRFRKGKNKKEKNGQDMIFQGLDFLLTGLSTTKKAELEKLIRENGGVVLPNLPPLLRMHMRGRPKTDDLGRNYPIVLSSQQVHTTKFLYGCAVGTLLLQPSWIADSIAAKCCLPFDKYRLQSNAATLRTCDKQKHINATIENAMPLFSGMGIMLYGRPTFYSKLTILIKHGGGLVFRTIKSLIHGRESGRAALAVIIVENVRAAPRHLRQCAAEYKLPVMSGNWVIESLLLGRLLPFWSNVSSGLQSLGKRRYFQSSLIKKTSRCCNITNSGTASVSGVKYIGAVDDEPSKNVKDAFSKEDIQLDGLSIVCSSEVSAIPFAVPKLGIKLPGKYAELPAKQKHQANYLYYQYVALNGARYSVGDVVELEPLSDAKGLSFA
ncbi:hypothetical protein SUGI_0805610 [Cryptomeria japonica]|uniref:uncharacterized protein LOC131031267 isoform X3 n=1 Tax=Cryptomeria japonica TaxID=3369 RepID=UPI0024148EC4|nr:uncharacterized protein LOC131031267 isoform X3 [Cryptomeria japonica]GLJ39443.1 hypothetical protein SUGI_0805610 [Cryptomeria japonica]